MNTTIYFDTKSFIRRNLSQVFSCSTLFLLSLNFLTLTFYFDDLTNEILISKSKRSRRQYVFVIVESIVGRHLTVFDFVYLIFQQASAIFYSKFTLSSVSFLVYLQLSKIILSANVHERLLGANIAIQANISLQLFIIIIQLILGKSKTSDEKVMGIII